MFNKKSVMLISVFFLLISHFVEVSLMALSPMALELIRLESLPQTSYFTKSYAIHRKGKAVKLLQDQLNFYEKNSPGEVINIFGKNGTGKSRMADSIAAGIIKKNNYVRC